MSKNKIRVYIDMDHTFCDFDEAKDFWKKRATTHVEKNWPWSMKGYFESLLPMKGALEFWKKWETKCDLWFLTKPSIPNRHSYTEKANWIHKYLGEEALFKLILSPRKELLIGDILIDDNHRAGQPEFQGLWWQFGTEKFPDWESIDEALTEHYNNHSQKLH
jgi:5'(3')-deoxyribonucleotidase